MDLDEAMEAIRVGYAVSRGAWQNPDLIVRLDLHHWPRDQVIGPRPFSYEDLRADDYFVVGAVN